MPKRPDERFIGGGGGVNASKITVSPSEPQTILTGDSKKFIAVLEPATATDTVSWEISGGDAQLISLTADETDKKKVQVTAAADKTGTVKIRAKTSGGIASNEVTVTITATAVPATDVTVAPASLALGEGESGTFTATVVPAYSTDSVTWELSDGNEYVEIAATGNTVTVNAKTNAAFTGTKTAQITVRAGTVIKTATVSVTYPSQQLALPPYPAAQAVLYTTIDGAKASGGIGKTYSVQLADRPYLSGYATVGDADKGTFRVPSIVKKRLDARTVRLIAAFDVRYRGTYTGNGDVGQSGSYGSDITVMYSDDGGKTWSAARNKTTGKKPAIDVKNAYGPDGTSNPIDLDTDVCDPQLVVAPDGTVYCGMAGGSGILGNNWSKSNFRIFKSTDSGETWEEDTDSANSYARAWRTASSSEMTNPKANLTTPGHGIVLTKNVPGVPSMTAGTMVMPCQGIDYGNGYGIYLAHGTGTPAAWTVGASGGSTVWGKWNGTNSEEGQICQLDDGRLLLASKTAGSTRLSYYANNSWTSIAQGADAFNGGGACQVSILKVADGDGSTKCGVVAVCRSLNGPSNTKGQGRGNLTVGFARDLSATGKAASSPLDNGTRYYVNIRTEGQCYFGYTDMVMIDENTLGVIYECWSDTDRSVNGMRFVAIDVSKIIENLSVIPM